MDGGEVRGERGGGEGEEEREGGGDPENGLHSLRLISEAMLGCYMYFFPVHSSLTHCALPSPG